MEEEIDLTSEDNVRWILGFQDLKFVDGPVWALMKQVLTYIAGSNTFTPYDLSCNHIRRSDSTTIHKDCTIHEKEYTNLIYLNKKWNSDLHGETIFLDGNDFVAAVLPKFGRLVVFEGSIDHSARPPSPNIHGKIFMSGLFYK